MGRMKKILAVIEPENSPSAVADRGAWVAKLLNSDLELC